MTTMKGRFICLEGIDGAGKTTMAQWLADHLLRAGHTVLLTHEPFAPVPEWVKREPVAVQVAWFILDRFVHVRERLQPALNAGEIVVCDRYYFSTIAYQGALGADGVRIRHDNEAFCPAPDLVLWLDISPREAVNRIFSSGRDNYADPYEKEPFLAQVRAHYWAMYDAATWHRIDASQPVALVQEAVWQAVQPLLHKE